jgi:hypothetical protein
MITQMMENIAIFPIKSGVISMSLPREAQGKISFAKFQTK